jgi:hypothetical protein
MFGRGAELLAAAEAMLDATVSGALTFAGFISVGEAESFGCSDLLHATADITRASNTDV